MRIKNFILLGLTSVTLSACTMAPGIYMSGPDAVQRELENNEKLNNGEAPAATLISIDAELLATQAQHRPAIDSVNHLIPPLSH